MYKVRYTIDDGKVNLITNGNEELHVQGHAYVQVSSIPNYDQETQQLYVENGEVVARDVE